MASASFFSSLELDSRSLDSIPFLMHSFPLPERYPVRAAYRGDQSYMLVREKKEKPLTIKERWWLEIKQSPKRLEEIVVKFLG